MARKAIKPLTDEEVNLEDLLTTGVNTKLEEDVIRALKDVDGLTDYLRLTMAEDMKRYFNATTPMEQLVNKGAFFRTKYLLKKIQAVEKKQKVLVESKKNRDVAPGRYLS